MQGTVHAILLIVPGLAALLSLFVLRRRVPTSRQFVVAFSLAALGMVAAAALSSHLCREGNPRHQILILGSCLLLTLSLVDSAAWRRVLGACLVVGMVGLSFHFAGLVHAPGWTGNPRFGGVSEQILRSLQKKAVETAADSTHPDPALPEGWLRDLPIGDALRPIFEEQHLYRREVRRVWHSPITGLYRYDRILQDFWYPGGPLTEGIGRVELRDRP